MVHASGCPTARQARPSRTLAAVDITPLHPWDLSPREAIALQTELAAGVVREGDVPERDVRLIAGADVAFDKPNGRAVGVVVLLAWPSLEIVDRLVVEAPVTFPYVPGLLSFRETPVLLEAFVQLKQRPDLLMVDGHGYAHARRFGFACHLGLLLDIPTVGVAKSRLVGEQGTVAGPRGSRADLTEGGEVIGSLLRTRQGVRSVYVSVGHRISLAAAERWALACARGYRLPEPTRLADRAAGEAKRRMLEATVDVVIEQLPGDTERWEWSPDAGLVRQRACPAFPAAYGCVDGIMNPADNELLDVFIAGDGPWQRGERVTVRIVDMLEGTDGDHKLLAAPIDRPRPGLAPTRAAILAWMRALNRPVRDWTSEDSALTLLRSLR